MSDGTIAESSVTGKPAGSGTKIDGRHERRRRTKQAIVDALIALSRETGQVPTAAQIAKRAGASLRSVFGLFNDFPTLASVAFDQVLAQRMAASVEDKVKADRLTRIRFQVEVRAHNCDAWLPLWRLLVRRTISSPDLKSRIELVYRMIRARIELMYRPELSTLPETERVALIATIEAITDFENWGRMRECNGLSYEATVESWVKAIDKLLPPTPPAAA